MYTKQQLINHLKSMGLSPSDSIMLHSSMKSIGEVEGGADTVLDSFMEYLSDGLFMAPAHTWAQMSETYPVFHPETEPACVGIIPNLFLKRPGVVRSLHPTHSIAAYGPSAKEYIKGEENCNTSCTPGGCWDRLNTIHAKILLVGVTHIRNTYIHSIEERCHVPERLTANPTLFYIKMPDNSLKPTPMYRHYNPYTAHISESFDKLSDAFFETGAAKRVVFGSAPSILCDASKLFSVTSQILSYEPNCCIDCGSIPKEWWQSLVP